MKRRDSDATDDVEPATRPRFQFDLRAVIAVTATIAVVLASVGRLRLLELVLAGGVFGLLTAFEAVAIRMFRRRDPLWSPQQVLATCSWFLLGMLAGYIVVFSTNAYDEYHDRGVWAVTCGMAAAIATLTARGSIPTRTVAGAGVCASWAGSFHLMVLSRRPDYSITSSVWEIACAALAGAAIVLVVDTLRRLEAHWRLPRYVVSCVWLVMSAAFAEIGSRFVPGW
jgi:hypothetical protein